MNDPAVDTFPLYEIEGNPMDRGVSYGEQAAPRIATAASLYRGALDQIGADADEVRSLADAFLDEVAEFDAALAEEIRGISHGSGVSLSEIVLINARRELLSMAGRKPVGAAVDDECTAAALLPETTASGSLLHGQNWDTSPEHARHSLVLRVRQRDGPNILTFTEAGAVARSGMNESGTAVTANHLACDRDYKTTGVPLPLIRRVALASDVYAKALSTIYATAKSGSSNMMVSHAGGEVVNIECAPDESFLLHPDDAGILTHANHWESAAALTKLRELGATDDPALAATPCTMFRSARIRRRLRALARQQGVDYHAFRESFLDDFGTPYSICRPPRPAAIGDGKSATAATIVMCPEEGFMDIAPMPALGAVWTRYRVDQGTSETMAPTAGSEVA